ncbi:Peptidase S1C, HrtA/DegP2/Q/S [Cystobacter fuscus DSM 2262]|uniref:Peptidase S1C, HrtA/DegP2/Q/S n=1 Tax=Cystobacter fuscus (strain ATCC 25194 / DSM 2262 / NBRC 100088 / M29) TaxID=1242864 RepID=S9QB37_CYSF2|nr:serine protease [Cystobacter fuscus]EPX58534.1 Peptidase S1C, HrtA/DegP2/Q/S [Cystobacter fuscus DSM 2262]
MPAVDTGLSAVRDAATSALITLDMPNRRGVGFVATPGGQLVTNLHMVAGYEEISALLADGRLLQVEQVIAFDEKHDLAVLQLPVSNLPALRLESGGMLPVEGDPVFILHPAPGTPPFLLETRVRSEQVLDESFTFLELEAILPEDVSGSPVLDGTGAWIGVATCAFADGRPVTIVIPSRYVLPLLERTDVLPLSTLGLARPAASRQRQIPTHSLSMLEGCAPDVLEEVAYTLLRAIQLGAPLYNRGDAAACYRLYAHTAERLIRERPDCPGIQDALRHGLERCARSQGADACAWALRDTLDGLLGVIGRWLQAQSALAYRAAPKAYLQ